MHHTRTWLLVSLLVLGVGGSFLLKGQAPTTPTVSAPTITPNLVTVNTPTALMSTVSISDPTLNPTTVELLRVNSNGTSAVVGRMRDDGQDGDKKAGDRIFTATFTVSEPRESQIHLQATASFKGTVKAYSPASYVDVWALYSAPAGAFQLNTPPNLAGDYRISSRGGQEVILVNVNPVSPDRAIVMAIQIFNIAASTSTISDVVLQRMNPQGIISSEPFLDGLLVEADTLSRYHFFQYHPATGKAIEVYGADVGFLRSQDFSKMVSTLRY